jgi:single-stranded DNA-binding protein
MSGIEAAMFGALGRDAESKVSKNGKQYLRLNIRVGDGDAAQWINATVFDADAIAIAAKLVKNSRVYLEGRLSLDAWTAQDGTPRHGLSIMSWHCRLSQIGRNKPAPDPAAASAKPRPDDPISTGRPLNADINDEIPY